MQMFPADGISAADVAEYKQQTRNEIDHIRDFIVLHCHVTQRQDSPFWRSCRRTRPMWTAIAGHPNGHRLRKAAGPAQAPVQADSRVTLNHAVRP